MEENPKWIIREIENFDDKELNNVLSSVMIEYGVPKKGTALSDPELKKMSKAYQNSRSIYYVIIKNNKIFGGAGISQLKYSKENICELMINVICDYIREERDERSLGMGR